MRKCGILMPVFSLPSNYGIGSFGKSAYEFIDFLEKTNQNYWQVLPLNPTAYGNSPYQSPSAFAGNPYFIDLDILYSEKLLTKKDLSVEKIKCDFIDYGRLFTTRYSTLKKAFEKFKKGNLIDFYNFYKQNSSWLKPYCLFMQNKEKYNFSEWTNWGEDKFYNKNAKLSPLNFWAFTQYEFFKQWKNLKNYANKKGIKIIGDMPIYVSYDSVDVWTNPNYYQLDENLTPTHIAGVPPDAFSDDGQVWGNPLYNYEVHKKENFKWFIKRFKQSLVLYDIIRIDHFRGFSAYYSIPYGDSHAKNGKWILAPGKELFSAINSKIKKDKIIAEDLGVIDEGVIELLKFTKYPCMKVAQFGFDEPNSIYLPKNYPENCVAYTGTHDNMTTLEWLSYFDKEKLDYFRKMVGKKGNENDVYALIKSVILSKAKIVIIPIQDYLLLGKEGRLNTPSVLEKNWAFVIHNYTKSLNKILNLQKGLKKQ